MTKKEFYNFIDEFNKKPGKYTTSELYEIGIKHKSLQRKDKNWDELAKYVGYVSGQAYRQFIFRYNVQEDTVKEIIKEDSEGNDEYEKLYKEKTQIRDIYNAYRLSLRTEARADAFFDNLANAMSNLKPMEIKEYNPIEIDENCATEAVLLLSDMHIGDDCKNFYNTYNVEVAYKRVSKLISYVIDYCKKFNVSKLHLTNLGDMIHGYIHTLGRIQSQLNVTEQVTVAADILTQALNVLQERIPLVTYRSCLDNHSRMTANYKESLPEENFELLIDMIVRERLKDSRIQFMDDNLDPSIMLFDVNGLTIMAAHGHLEKPDKVIDDFTGAIRRLPDVVLLSHFHATRMKSYNGSKLFINGSIVGTEEYALGKRLFNPAEQLLLIFDNENIISANIMLQDTSDVSI